MLFLIKRRNIVSFEALKYFTDLMVVNVDCNYLRIMAAFQTESKARED